MRRDPACGVILINVLVVLALASIVLLAMLRLGDISVVRSQRFSEAGAAVALLQAGEQSAVAALRRDMRGTREIDHAWEPWAAIGQAPVPVFGGTFSLDLRDAQDRFNLNRLAEDGSSDSQLLRSVVAVAKLPPETADRIIEALEAGQPLEAPEDLVPSGVLTAEELELIAPFVTALPGSADININSASPEMLEAIFGNRTQPRLVVAIRNQRRGLSPDDLEDLGIFAPDGVVFGSSLFRLRVTARVGDVVQRSESLLQRVDPDDGDPAVAVIRRRTGPPGQRPPPSDPDVSAADADK